MEVPEFRGLHSFSRTLSRPDTVLPGLLSLVSQSFSPGCVAPLSAALAPSFAPDDHDLVNLGGQSCSLEGNADNLGNS